MTTTIAAKLIVDDPESAHALFDDLDPAPSLVRRMDAEALAIGFELMAFAECPPEITHDGRLKVWMCQIGPTLPVPDFETNAEWLAYWRANTPPLTAGQKRKIAELLDLRVAAQGKRA